MRPVRGVHDPQREVMTRSVICVGCRPITGPHLASSCGNVALIAAAACRLRSSVQIWERSKYGWTFVPAWPGPASPIPGRLISPVFGRPATPPSWPLAPATPRPPFSKPAPSFNAMMERRCASAMRCCWARIHECRSLTKSAIQLSLIRIGAEISTRPLGGLMRRYRFLMGLRVRCRWMPSISNDCSAAADRTDFGAPDFGAVD